MARIQPTTGRRYPSLSRILAALLTAFSVGCVVLLIQAQDLRKDLGRSLGWLDEIHRLTDELERQRSARLAASGSEAPHPVDFSRAREVLGELASNLPDLQVAARNLKQTLADAEASSGPEEPDSDAFWQASSSALTALSPLERRIQGLATSLLGRLDRHWTSLNVLVIASLLLAGSNLVLLRTAQRQRRELEDSHREIERQGSHDALTGLWNRGAILKLLWEELARAERSSHPLGVIFADLDRFHEINVLIGQDQGDYVLEEISGRMDSMVRPYDTVGRLGGDSFLVILPACDEAATANVAERLRAAVNEKDVDHGLGKVRVTMSLAYGTVSPRGPAAPSRASAAERGASRVGPDRVAMDLLLHRLQETVEQARSLGPGQIAALQEESRESPALT